jgi:hypothetical protein
VCVRGRRSQSWRQPWWDWMPAWFQICLPDDGFAVVFLWLVIVTFPSVSCGNTLLLPYGVQLCQKNCWRSLLDEWLCALQCREGLIFKEDEGKTSSVSLSGAVNILISRNYTFYVLFSSSPSTVLQTAVGTAGLQPQAPAQPRAPNLSGHRRTTKIWRSRLRSGSAHFRENVRIDAR